jgi:hypothetical protein
MMPEKLWVIADLPRKKYTGFEDRREAQDELRKQRQDYGLTDHFSVTKGVIGSFKYVRED